MLCYMCTHYVRVRIVNVLVKSVMCVFLLLSVTRVAFFFFLFLFSFLFLLSPELLLFQYLLYFFVLLSFLLYPLLTSTH